MNKEAKTRPHAPRRRYFVRIMAVLGWLACTCVAARAQERLLTVKPFRDAGGLPPRLSVRLTSALVRFLTDHAEAGFTVTSVSPGAVNPGACRYQVEGDISYATGRREDAGRFLMTARLYRTGARPLPIGQWTGVSSSLRTLTANLHHERGVNTFGLIGELGSRISVCLTMDADTQGQRFTRIEAHMRPAAGETPEIVDPAGELLSIRTLKAETAFRLRFRSAPADRAYYLLIAAASGELRLAPLTTTTPYLPVPHGRRLTSIAVHLPDDTIDSWIVWRRSDRSLTNCRAALPLLHSLQQGCLQVRMERAGRGLDFRQQALASLSPPGSTGSEDAPSVQVLNGVGSDAAEPDPKVEQLLIEIGREPAHWSSCRIAIKPDRH